MKARYTYIALPEIQAQYNGDAVADSLTGERNGDRTCGQSDGSVEWFEHGFLAGARGALNYWGTSVHHRRICVIDGVVGETSMDNPAKKDNINDAEEIVPEHDSE